METPEDFGAKGLSSMEVGRENKIFLDDRRNDLSGRRRFGQRVGERRFPVVSPGR